MTKYIHWQNINELKNHRDNSGLLLRVTRIQDLADAKNGVRDSLPFKKSQLKAKNLKQ